MQFASIIRGLIGSPSEQKDAYTQVGYYYKCIAPASIYKYFRADQRSIVAVKENKLWYSAPCKFNDVFDCDILIDEKAILNSVLKQFPDKRGVRPGSPVWKEVQKQIAKEIPSLRTTLDGLKTKTGMHGYDIMRKAVVSLTSMEQRIAFMKGHFEQRTERNEG